jgi:hypothetical protein
MTKGVLLFALNNSEINYIKMAEDAAKRIHKFLNVPVSVITDSDSAKQIAEESLFDNVIVVEPEAYHLKRFHDGDKIAKSHWKNSHRNSSFDLSPYDETLVVDVDYVVNSDVLSYCWNQPHDFLIYKKAFDLGQRKDVSNFTHISDYSIPFYWATVFYFRKTDQVEQFFALVSHVKAHWRYYKFLFQIQSSSFRNDFAFSVAIHIMNGYSSGDFAKALPGKLFYTLDRDIFVKKKERDFYFLVEKEKEENEYIPLKVSNNDVHIMNKYSLLRMLEND